MSWPSLLPILHCSAANWTSFDRETKDAFQDFIQGYEDRGIRARNLDELAMRSYRKVSAHGLT